MERIIHDKLIKKEKRIFGDDPTTEFNKKIIAVNNMYRFLYEKGILEKEAFQYKDFPEETYFALDVADIEKYKDEMLNSGIEDAELAVKHIFDVEYTPCLFCGAIELAWTMSTYRDSGGCIGRSWECGYCQSFYYDILGQVLTIKKEKGAKEAVKEEWKHFKWRE